MILVAHTYQSSIEQVLAMKATIKYWTLMKETLLDGANQLYHGIKYLRGITLTRSLSLPTPTMWGELTAQLPFYR